MDGPGGARGQWETIRGLHGKKRWEYLWSYYKLPIFGVLILVYALGYGAYRFATHKDAALYVAFVNVSAGENLTEELTGGFLRDQGLHERKNQIITYQGLTLTESDAVDRQYVYAAEMKLLAAMSAQHLDVVLMDAEARDVFARNGYLAGLRQSPEGDAPLWVDVSASPFFKGFGAPVYLGVLGNSPRQDMAEAYLAYVLGG